MKDNKKYPEGYFVGIGIALGIPLGIPLALSLGNMGFIGTGLPIGLAIGLALEEKYKREGRIRPLNEKDKSRKKLAFILGLGALAIGVIAFFIMIGF